MNVRGEVIPEASDAVISQSSDHGRNPNSDQGRRPPLGAVPQRVPQPTATGRRGRCRCPADRPQSRRLEDPPASSCGPISPTPGRPHGFNNNWDFNALGTIFERCTGRSVFAALAEDLAAPLGFDDFDPGLQRLLGRPDVSEHLAHHFFLSARDLGRLGAMMLQNGRWDGRQVIPASWVAESTSIQVDRGAGVQLDYGYLWWLPRLLGHGSFLAIGNFGQFLLCRPPGLVIVHLRAVPEDIVLARSQGTQPASIDSVTPQQFMKVVRAVLAAFRP